jgi:hypothetical protein
MDAASEYEDLPLNGLATTADILEQQMRVYGITLDDDNAFSDIREEPTAASTAVPTESDGSTTPTPTVVPVKRYVYDGPVDTGKSFGDILAQYGIPTSVSKLITNAEDAFVGIPEDIQKGEEPIYTILTKDARLQGIGAALVIIAVVVGVIQALL